MHSGIPFADSIALWAIGAFILYQGLRYILVARVYLTCAARSLRFDVARGELTPEERLVLESADQELADAGFRLLFVGQVNSLLTLSDQPELFRVFVADDAPVRAIVGRRVTPELGGVITIELETTLADGKSLVTKAWRAPDVVSLPGRVEEFVPNADVARLKERHLERLAAGTIGAANAGESVPAILAELNKRSGGLRLDLRAKHYTVPTSDPELDRFTLTGALRLANLSIQRRRGVQKKAPATNPRTQPRPIFEADRALRVAADIIAVRRIADHPLRAPGSDSALWVMMLVTAAVFFAGMSVVWNPTIAVIILAVVAFHEAGHALAMRFAGYRDVNVFFVPFVGALTVGRDTGASVRQRLTVMLAGPVPGLWLALAAFMVLQQSGTVPFLKPLAVALLLVNGLNLLPITPLDGGRALELLTPPDSMLRLGIQGASGLCLLGLGLYFSDGFLILVGAWWLVLLKRQSALIGLRRQVAKELAGRRERAVILETVCTVLLSPAYASWRGIARVNTTRALVQQFSVDEATGADRYQAILLYVFAWAPAAAALYIWKG